MSHPTAQIARNELFRDTHHHSDQMDKRDLRTPKPSMGPGDGDVESVRTKQKRGAPGGTTPPSSV